MELLSQFPFTVSSPTALPLPPPPPLFLAPGPPPVYPPPRPQGPAPSGVSQVDTLLLAQPIEVAVYSCAARGAGSGGAEPASAQLGGAELASAELGGAEHESTEPRGANSKGAESRGAEPEGAELGGAESEDAETGCAEPRGTVSAGDPAGASPRLSHRREHLSPQHLREWFAQRTRIRSGTVGAGGSAAGGSGAGDPGATSPGGAGVTVGAGGTGGARAAGPGGARTRGTGAAEAGGVGDTRQETLELEVLALEALELEELELEALVREALELEALVLEALALEALEQEALELETLELEVLEMGVLELEALDYASRLNYFASLIAEFESDCHLFVGGECALGTDVLGDRQEDFECLAAAVPHLVAILLALEGDPNAPSIPTPRSYAEAITGPYSSQWHTAMDAKMASWKSTGTYVDAVPPPGVKIVDGMWIFGVKRLPGSPPVFKARYVARGFNQRQGVDFFHTFSPTPKMTTLRVLLHVTAQHDYELHSFDFSTAFLQGSLHEEIWLHRPPGFIGTTLAALGFPPSTAYPSLFLRTHTPLPPLYVLVYVDDLVFATAGTEGLALVKLELQKRHTCIDLGELRSYLGLQITRDRARRTITLTQSHMVHQVLQRFGSRYSSPQSTPLPTGHSLSAPRLDESVEPSGLYPELVGSLITSGMGLVLGGRGAVVLIGHVDASWVDILATQQSSQGYTFSLGCGSVSWRSTRSTSVPSSCSEAEIYAGAMAALELRWLTYLLTYLGERPSSSPILYVDNKAMIALC
ncbi:unnamed protein product [Closterium sp. NIES-53]